MREKDFFRAPVIRAFPLSPQPLESNVTIRALPPSRDFWPLRPRSGARWHLAAAAALLGWTAPSSPAQTLAADLAAADQATAAGDFATALLWTAGAMSLAPGDPLVRWRAGNLIRQVPLLRASLPHAAGVNSVAFSPDGRLLVTASQDRSARIWDAATGRALGPPLAAESAVTDAEFSPDGRTVVTAEQGERSASGRWPPAKCFSRRWFIRRR